MQLGFSALSSHLEKNLKPLYALHGDEILLQNEATDLIRQAARAKGYTERTSFTVQGANFDWSDVQNAGQTCSAGSRVLIEASIYESLLARLGVAFTALRVGPASAACAGPPLCVEGSGGPALARASWSHPTA